MRKEIKIGKNKKVESRVSIGAIPTRGITNFKLVVGDHAYLRSGTVLYIGSKIGHGLQTGHNVIIREENQIGDHLLIWSNSIIDYGCKIGDRVKIHCNSYVAQFTTIEDEVFLAPGVIIANDLHPASPDAIQCMKGPTIKRGAQVGCNVTLLPHITIGECALIGAGSVVTKSIPPYSVAYGNPARVVKEITEVQCRVRNHTPYDFLSKS